jgi:hypothetical protein
MLQVQRSYCGMRADGLYRSRAVLSDAGAAVSLPRHR